MAVRRLRALFSVRCGWTLKYINALPLTVAIEHADSLRRLGLEDMAEALQVSSAPWTEKQHQRTIWAEVREPWRDKPRRGTKIMSPEMAREAERIERQMIEAKKHAIRRR